MTEGFMFKEYFLAAFLLFILKAFQSEEIYEEQVIHKLGDQYLVELEERGIQCPEVVVAQMCLETNYLQSKIYKENHNLFGMKESSRNWDIGSKNGHANYISEAHSLLDYRDWQKARFGDRKFKSNEEYIYALGHLFKRKDGSWARYAEDRKYEEKLLNIIKILYRNE